MIYLSKTNRPVTEKYIKFVQEGITGSSILPPYDLINKTDTNEVWLFGILRGTNLVYKHCVENKIKFYFMDRPYWGVSRQSPFFVRIVQNAHVKNFIEERPDDRFKATFPFEIKPYHKNGKKILVCPPTNAIQEFFGVSNWLENTLKELRKHTDREIIIREKPYNPEVQVGADGIIQTGKNNSSHPNKKIDWKELHAVVTYNSSITIEALANGVPVFTDGNNCAYPIASKHLSLIEKPIYHDPRPLFYSLAYGQFTAEEMKDGSVKRLIHGR